MWNWKKTINILLLVVFTITSIASRPNTLSEIGGSNHPIHTHKHAGYDNHHQHVFHIGIIHFLEHLLDDLSLVCHVDNTILSQSKTCFTKNWYKKLLNFDGALSIKYFEIISKYIAQSVTSPQQILKSEISLYSIDYRGPPSGHPYIRFY